MTRLYSVTWLLRGGAIFVRMLQEFRRRVEEVAIMREAPLAVATVYLQEFKAYVKTNHNRFRKCQENGKQHQWVADVDCSSESEGGGQDHRMEHTCERSTPTSSIGMDGGGRPPSSTGASTQRVAQRAGRRPSRIRRRQRSRSLFRASVSRMACNKWTRLGVVLAWLLLGTSSHGIVGRCLQRLGLDAGQQKEDEPAVEDIDEQLN